MTGQILLGQRALVTGASRGIGRAIAIALASAGADVVASARTPDSFQGLREEVEGCGRTYLEIACDLSVPHDVTRFSSAVLEISGGIDILVCAAGLAERAPAEQHSDQQWAHAIQVNLTSQFLLARDLGAGMLDRGHGKVILVGSMMSFQGGRDVVSYAASKSALIGVVHALANEWAGRGVNVNAVAPGYVESDLTAHAHLDPERNRAIRERIPAGRWAKPEDIAGPVVFLASQQAEYIHGVVLPVDGGWLVR